MQLPLNMQLVLKMEGPKKLRRRTVGNLNRSLTMAGWQPCIIWTDDEDFPMFEIVSPTYLPDELHKMLAQLVVLAFADAAAEASEKYLWAKLSSV